MTKLFNLAVGLILIGSFYGCTPAVIRTSAANDLDGLKGAVAQGANVNIHDEDIMPGSTPLVFAIRNNNFEMTKYLLEHGADANLKTGLQRTPLWYAATEANLDIVRVLVEKGASVGALSGVWDPAPMPLHAACNVDKLDIVQYLLGKGADVNTYNRFGITPLMDAAAGGRLAAVKFLLEHGAKIDMQSAAKDTALHWAVARSHKDVAQYLVERGADSGIKNNANKTAFDLATTSDMKQFVATGVQRIKEEKLHGQVNALIAKKDFAGLTALAEQNPDAVNYIPNPELRLSLTGPKDMKVGDIRKLLKSGKSEAIVVQLIKRAESPYKEFTVDEVELLSKMGLTDSTVAAMMEVTTTINKDEKRRKEQAIYLAAQNSGKAQTPQPNVVVQPDVQNNQPPSIADQIGDQVTKELANRALRRILPF